MRSTLVAISGFSLFLIACPAEDADGNDDGAGTEAATTDMATSSMMTMTTMDPSMTSNGTTSGPVECDNTDAALIDTCKQQAADMGTCPEVGDCACDSCACELAACEADPGCTAIRECAQMVGCMGLDCYAPETCMQVIDDAGGVAGDSAAIGLELNSCIETAMCPVSCDEETSTGSSSSGGGATGSSSSGG